MIWARALLSVLVLPAMVVGYIPYLLSRQSPRINLGPAHLLGLPILILGAMILLWCVWAFVVYGRGTLAPIDPPKELVARGLYRYVRNPMYVGGFLVNVGSALWTGATWLFAYTAVIAIAWHLFVLLYEEPKLTRLFGQSYTEYREHVPRWIPNTRTRPD